MLKTQKTSWVSLVGFAAGLGALVVLGFAFSIVIRPGMPQAQPTPSATLNFSEQREIMETAVMQTELALIETVTPEAPPTGRPPTLTPAPFIPGIFEISTYGSPRNYAMSSLWKDIVNDERVLVYAGARKDTSGATPDVTQGLVVVQVYSRDLSNKNTTEYEAPGSTGILQITAVTGYRLTLVGQNGEKLYFDVPTRQFVDRLDVTLTAPTATHLPPITPTPTWAPPTGYPPLSAYPQPKTSVPPTRAAP